jgi:hypothetical protein
VRAWSREAHRKCVRPQPANGTGRRSGDPHPGGNAGNPSAPRRGIDPLAPPVTRKSLISVSVFTGVLWIGYAALVVTTGEWVFPATPALCTVWLAFQIHRWRTRLR